MSERGWAWISAGENLTQSLVAGNADLRLLIFVAGRDREEHLSADHGHEDCDIRSGLVGDQYKLVHGMKPRYAWAAAIACTVAVLIACGVWIHANPLPSYYDEALYAIYGLIDVWAAKTYGLSGAFYAMLKVDPYQPPALRILALPFTLIAGPSLTFLRWISLAGFVAALAITALAVKRASGAAGSALSVVMTVSLPVIVLSCRMFHTEYALMLAVSLLLLGLTSQRSWWMFAISVALGLLAKASYPLIAIPMFIVAMILEPERRKDIVIGGAIGTAIGAIWWIPDWRTALSLVQLAGSFIRHAHPDYVYELLRCNFGFAIAAAVVLCFMTKRWHPFAMICIAGAIPSIVMHAAAVGHNPRHIAVQTALIAIAAATLADARKQWAVLALAVLQVAIMVWPRHQSDDGSYIWRGVTEVMAPVPQWDWSRLRKFTDARGLTRPRIAILGDGYAFNPPQIRYGWPDLRGEVPVESLYEWSSGKKMNPRAVIERAAQAQIAITASGFHGEATDGQVPNNVYNALFASALARDPRFDGPYVIDVGVRHPAPIQVFVRQQ